MKIIEVLKFNRELIKRLKIAGIRLEDEEFVDLYTDYTTLLNRGEKVSYIIARLSEKYAVSERKVYMLIKRFQSDCKSLAVWFDENALLHRRIWRPLPYQISATMRKQHLSAPLPFQGRKRMFAREYIKVLQQYPDGTTFVDLFGGSGLLSHIAKCQKPNSTVVYNDFDGYRKRLEALP